MTQRPHSRLSAKLRVALALAGVSVLFCGTLVGLVPAAAQAVNPAALTAPAKPPPSGQVTTHAIAPNVALEAPPDADKTFVTIRRVTIGGAFPELAEQNGALVAKLQGRRLSLAEIYEAARELQRAYSSAYPLARIAMSPRDVRGGDVRITVTDDYIEKLDLSGVPEKVRDLVRARVEPLVGKRHLTAEEYQRRTILIGTLAGVNGGAVVAPGASDGASTLVIQVVDPPVVSSALVSNRLPKDYGTFMFSKSVALNNALGLGEQLSANVASGPDFDRFFDGTQKYQAYGAEAVLPIGIDGLTVTGGYAAVRSMATPWPGAFPEFEEFGGERARQLFERFRLQADYPIFLMADKYLKVAAAFEHIDDGAAAGPTPFAATLLPAFPDVYSIYHDQFSVMRGAAEAKTAIPSWDWGGVALGTLGYSHGLGGRTAWDSPFIGAGLSRPGSGPDFNKLTLKGRVDLNLPEQFHFSFTGRAQTSFGQPLPVSENLVFDSPDAVSGFAAGTIYADRGVTLRSELSRPTAVAALGAQAAVEPYIFGAWGRGVHEWPFPGEPHEFWVETFGGGLRANTALTGAPFGELLALEFGKDLSNIPWRENGYRTNLTFVVNYAGDPLAAELPGQAPVAKNLVRKGPPEYVPPPILWDGFYAGLNAGYSWDPRPYAEIAGVPVQAGLDNFFSAPGAWSFASAAGVTGKTGAAAGGEFGGGQIGYNHQYNRFVLGVEADIQGSNTRGISSASNLTAANVGTDLASSSVRQEKNTDWLGTLRGRVGYLVTPKLLGYATGGFAFGGVSANTVVSQSWGGGPLGPLLQSSGAVGQFSDTRLGWTIGAGLEWMFAPNLSAKVEYLYYDLGSASYGATPLVTYLNIPGTATNTILPLVRTQFTGDVVRVGLNYQFGQKGAGAAEVLPEAKFRPGIYAGLNSGYSWGASPNVTTTAVPVLAGVDSQAGIPFSALSALSATGVSRAQADGFLGGGQIGYNHQQDQFLMGLEGDFQGAGIAGAGGHLGYAALTAPAPSSYATSGVDEKTIDWLSTLRGRVGYLITPSLLGYATGGLAFGGVTAQSSINQSLFSTVPNLQGSNAVGRYANVQVGWTVGAGMEWMFTPDLSLKAEYLYYDLGEGRYGSSPLWGDLAFNNGGPGLNYLVNAVAPVSRTRYEGQIARLGLNYHFDPLALGPFVVK